MAGQPQSYGSIREFLDNLPSQPCIWQPENANICVTCLRINEPVARVCSVWAQALEEAPLEEIDFEEEVMSFPSVVEIEDEFEIVETADVAIPVASTVAEVDIVEATSDWDMVIEDSTEEVAEAVTVETTEEVAEAVAVETTEEIAEAVIEASTDATEDVVESVVIQPEEIKDTEEITLDTIQDAVDAENIAKENVEIAAETEVVAAEAVIEAINTETEAVESYAEAVKEEVQAADVVVEAVKAKNVATEAVIESVEQVSELVDNDAKEEEIKEIVTELKENVEKQQEAEEILAEAITNEDIAAEEVEVTSDIEDQASDDLERAIEADKIASKDLVEAITKEEMAEEEVQEVVETSKTIKSINEEKSNHTEPFFEGDQVTHGVYGNGTVLQLNKAGKHWSVEVDFEEGKRRILGTFLTLNQISESQIEKQEPNEQSFKRPESKDNTDGKPIEEKHAQITEVIAETVETDYGEYSPGTKISHDIFGNGEVKNSKPKGEAYRLDLIFEDGSERTLLSTFVKLVGEHSSETVETEPVEAETVETESIEAETVEAEPVEAETVEAEPVEAETVEAEPAEAETVKAEPVEAETVLDTDIIYQRPKKDKELILDLSKPEVQDAEMIDDED